MTRRVGTATLAASLGGLATAAALIVALSSPSVATPDNHLDAAAVDAAVLGAARTLFPAAAPGTPPPAAAEGIGAFDPATATWHLRTRGGDPTVFVFGSTGSTPLMGDWNGDGVDTVGVYDTSSASVSLRNANTAGDPDLSYQVGLPGDVPIAGDFDGDDTDTISVFRPSNGFVYVYNTTGSALGDPAATYAPAGSAEFLIAGDFNGDGVDTIGSWNPSTGAVIVNTPGGAQEAEFNVATAGSHVVAGDWTGDGVDAPGVFDAPTATFHLRYVNADGAPDESYTWGTPAWIPVAGSFGDLTSSVTVNVDGAPQSLAWAVESLYLELGDAPHFDGEAGGQFSPTSVTEDLGVDGIAMTAEAYGGHVAVVTTDTDTILAVSDDGWTWRVVGGTLASRGFTATAASPRFVTIIGSDWATNPDGTRPPSPLQTHADSIHIFSVDPAAKTGAIVGIPRDTAVPSTGAQSIDGMEKINTTMWETGPEVPTALLAAETGLPIEGYFVTGFGSAYTGFPGFEDLVDAMGGVDFLVPYSVPSQCVSNPPPPATASEGDTHIDGRGSLSLSRERKCIPPIVYSGNTLRTATQGLLMKAAVAEVQKLGSLAVPGLIRIMEKYVTTDLLLEEVSTLAYALFDIDPGPMPTLTPADIATLGYDAYNLNPGDLPNVVVDGCWGILGDSPYTQYFVSGNYGTFADLADGRLDTYPIYEYDSGDSASPYACPWLLPSSVTRLAGSNRYATAAEISKSKFTAGVPVVYVATGTNFPDALTAGPVAALNLGPILLVEANAIPSATANELARLKPKRIVVVGGTAVVSSAVQSQLASYTTGNVSRLAGSNRYATAAEISKSKFSPGVPVVHISTGLNFPDALAASPVAALNGGPVLLVEPNAIPSSTAAELSRLRPGRIVIVGGTAAVSASVQSQLANYTTGGVTRLAAANRYATAAEISKARFSPGVPTVFIATGLNFPDALAGGPVAGYSGKGVSPILLVEQNAIPSATRNELSRLKPHSIVILGGTAAVSNQVMADLGAYASP